MENPTRDTIDYGISKLNEALQAIKPTAMDLGEQFVSYTVLKQTVYTAIIAVILLAFITTLAVGTVRVCKEGWGQDLPTTGAVCFCVGMIGTMFTSLEFATSLYAAILANMYPLMYTIEQLTK